MVQVLPENPSFGQMFARNLSAGLGRGVNQASQVAAQNFLEKQKMAQRQKILDQIEGGGQKQVPKQFSDEFNDNISKLEDQMGFKFTPEQVESISDQLQGVSRPREGIDPFSKAKQYAAVGEHELAKLETERAKSGIKESREEKKVHTDRAFKFLDEVSKKEESFGEREAALNAAVAAVESGQMTPFGGDFWADTLGLPQLRSASGAQLQGAAKANLVGTIEKLTGARMNQFMEKQVNAAFPTAGETKESQKAKLLIMRAVLDMEKNHVNAAENIASEQREKYGYPRESIREETNKLSKEENKGILRNLNYDLRKNLEQDIGIEKLSKLKKVAPGTPLTYEMKEILMDKVNQDPEKAMKLAKGLGFEIPTDTSVWER